jgi:NADP-reducing hydrogenase subunit HndD
MPKVTINNKVVDVPPRTMILDAVRQIGIEIPTLCYLQGKEPLGACRVCMVEIEGGRNLAAACSTPIVDGMVIRTNTKAVREARKMVIEMLLSEHEGDCQYCFRSEDCELKKLAFQLGVREMTYQGEKPKRVIDESSAALVRDSGKCIKCRRCVTVCNEVQKIGALFPQNRGYATLIGPAFTLGLSDVPCVQCGQCGAVCPVGAIVERNHMDLVWAALEDKTKHVIVQTAPAIRAALGECFGYPPGTLVTGKMVTALREMGFNAVFDTNFTADLTIVEEGTELLLRLKKALVNKEKVALPQFSSCSPGWIKFVEHFYPEMIPNLSSCKSPQQMFGALAKTFYARKKGIDPKNIVVVSVMPCTAKKFEAGRAEMNGSGFQDVDYVLTTRELGQMIQVEGIQFNELPDGVMDSPLGISSGAADIFANSGGVMEAAVRTAYELVTGRELPTENLHIQPLAGLKGIKEASLKLEKVLPAWSFLEGVELKVAVAHSLSNAAVLVEKIKAGQADYHFVEVMTCPGGCIGGGGQPRFTTDDVRQARINAIYKEDEGKTLRKSHENPDVKKLYEEFLTDGPCGHKSHELLHTHYIDRKML